MSKNEFYNAETYYQKAYNYAKDADSLFDKVVSSASLGALYGSLLDPTIQQHSNNTSTGKTARFNLHKWQLNLTQLQHCSPTSTSQPSPTLHKSTQSYSLPRLSAVEKSAVEKSLGHYGNAVKEVQRVWRPELTDDEGKVKREVCICAT